MNDEPTKTITITLGDDWLAKDRAANPHHWALHEEMMSRLCRGGGGDGPNQWVTPDGKHMARCPNCGKVIRVGRWLGTLHLCA